MAEELTIKVTGPSIVIECLRLGLADSSTVTMTPDAIFPGYVVDVVEVI